MTARSHRSTTPRTGIAHARQIAQDARARLQERAAAYEATLRSEGYSEPQARSRALLAYGLADRICFLQREAARLKIAIPLCMAKANAKSVNVNDPDSLIRAAYKVLHRIACDLEGDIDEEEQKVIDALQFYCNGFGRTP